MATVPVLLLCNINTMRSAPVSGVLLSLGIISPCLVAFFWYLCFGFIIVWMEAPKGEVGVAQKRGRVSQLMAVRRG